MRAWLIVFGVLFALASASSTAFAQSSRASVRAEFEKKLTAWRIEASQRHLVLGLDCRKKGMVQGSAHEIVRAQEISAGANPGATEVYYLLRTLDEAFWRKHASKPSKAELASYAKEARKLDDQDSAERIALALWVYGKGQEADAHAEFVELLRQRDEPFVFDAKGALLVGSSKIPPKAAERLRAEAIEINGVLRPRDVFLSRIPELTSIFEHQDERLRVRSTRSTEEARTYFELAKAALEPLESVLQGRPDRRLSVALFSERKMYELYLESAGLSDYRVVRGVADRVAGTAVLCTEDFAGTELEGLVLHELAHLFEFGVSPAVMPHWYREGFAEAFGGSGTYEWRDGKLLTGLTFDRERLARLKDGFLPLARFLREDPLELWHSDAAAAQNFYAQSWALYRFLESGAAGKDFSDRFEAWELECRGRAVGVVIGKPQASDSTDADALLWKRFEKDLDALERGLREWIAGL